MSAGDSKAATPYSTGGGGVVLEQMVGAAALASLLAGAGFRGLPEGQRVVRLSFQAGNVSPIDDLLVTGRGADGDETVLALALRRSPTIGPSDEKLVALVGKMLELLDSRPVELERGTWRIGLGLAGPHTGGAELGELCALARAHADDASWTAAVGRERAALRKRSELVRGVIERAGIAGSTTDDARVWRLLRSLWVIQTDFESEPSADLARILEPLRAITDRPGALWSELRTLSADLNKQGGVVDEATARRALRGKTSVGVRPSAPLRSAAFQRMVRRVESRTARHLELGEVRLQLPRGEPLAGLLTILLSAEAPVLVVGDPDVGKSALAAEAVAQLEREGDAAAVRLSLRDLPGSVFDLEHGLGAGLDAVLGGAAVAPRRLLLVDGAEAVLQGRRDVLEALVRTGLKVGLGPVVVTRTDARGAVQATMEDAGSRAPVQCFEVPPLNDAEVGRVIEAFPVLEHVRRNPRAVWLLRRLRFVQSILRAGAREALRQSETVCEATVFDTAWNVLVRRRGATERDGVPPDAREAYLLWMARKELGLAGGFDGHGGAAASLRQDGLLLPADEGFAWRKGDDFADDLVRDFAVARLLCKDGLGLLAEAEAPRWALRAARLACQAMLLASQEAGSPPGAAHSTLQSSLDPLVESYGARWADLITEAMLTLGDPRPELGAAADQGLVRDPRWLSRLVRVLQQRHGKGRLLIDATVGRPVVELLLERSAELPRRGHELREAIDDVVLGWLRAMRDEGSSDPLRAALRATFLAGGLVSRRCNLTALSLLGPDLDGEVAALLRAEAAERPHSLSDCVEKALVPQTMAAHQPELLVELTEAYYIEKPRPDDYYRGVRDEGIRHHWNPGGPLAAWYLGPFWAMLHARPVEGLAVIQRLLNHAAQHRARTMERFGTKSEYVLRLPGVGEVTCAGDSHAWAWYRGTTVGPYPAMSALMALDRFTDKLLAAGAPLARVVEALLVDCRNLAMPGLVMGLLVRYLDRVVDELDPWLSDPQVWHLEFERAVAERSGLRLADDSGLVGADRRAETPHDLVRRLIQRAVRSDDHEALQRFARVADALSSHPSIEGEHERLTVEGWAASLRWEQYAPVEGPDGEQGAVPVPPPAVIERMMAERPIFAGQQELLRLHMNYLLVPGSFPSRPLADDLRTVRVLEEQFSGGEMLAGAALGIASAVLIQVLGGLAVEADDEEWCRARVLDFAARVAEDCDAPGWYGERGLLRAVCRGLVVLALREGEIGEDARGLLGRLVGAGAGAVRLQAGEALRFLWAAPCSTPSTGRLHREALRWVEAAGRRLLLPPPGQDSRELLNIEGPLGAALVERHPRDLDSSLLPGPIVAAAGCVDADCCASLDARSLLGVLLSGYGHTAEQWGKGGPPLGEGRHVEVVRALLRLPADDPEGAAAFALKLAAQPTAQASVLRAIRLVATADVDARAKMRALWPGLMEAIVGLGPRELDHGDRLWDPVVEIVPEPEAPPGTEDIDAVLAAAADGWLTFDEVAESVERWLEIAPRTGRALSSLVGFVRLAPPDEQVLRGLTWVDRLVGGEWPTGGSRPYLLFPWLRRLRSRVAERRGEPRRRYLRIVDAMATAGYSDAVKLQEQEE